MNHTTPKNEVFIGVISDTHGLVRPEAIEALRGAHLIFHAGDIGKPEVLSELGNIAPVQAVRGNIDKGPWAESIPQNREIDVSGTRIYMIHDVKDLDLSPAASGIHIVISGHSHKPVNEERDGVLFLNPGSAGPRRFSLPICLAHLRIRTGKIKASIIDLL